MGDGAERADEIDEQEHLGNFKGFHVGEYIQDEMNARQWSRSILSQAMVGARATAEEIAVARLSLDLLIDAPRVGMLLGLETAEQLSRAFGSSSATWMNLDAAWQAANTPPEGADS